METFSVSFRLQRTTTEYAYVRVSVTDDLIVEQPDGRGKMNVAGLAERALEMGHAAEVVWHPEEQDLRMHPLQKAPEPHER